MAWRLGQRINITIGGGGIFAGVLFLLATLIYTGWIPITKKDDFLAILQRIVVQLSALWQGWHWPIFVAVTALFIIFLIFYLRRRHYRKVPIPNIKKPRELSPEEASKYERPSIPKSQAIEYDAKIVITLPSGTVIEIQNTSSKRHT